MSAAQSVAFSRDGDGVGWIVFDDPAARANVFNPTNLAALEAAIDEAEKNRPRAIVVMSGKEKIFIAGADLRWLASLADAATAVALARRGQKLFQRLADFPVPVVCAIHGACAGGGTELALACHGRIASDAPATRIGLPETSIGTIPGWGGCVRLPRLIGVKPALDHILKAQLVSAGDALKVGLVDAVVPPAELRAAAKSAALQLATEEIPARPVQAVVATEYFSQLRAATAARTRGHQPALVTAIDAVQQTATLPMTEALEVEARLFGEVTVGETCKNFIRVFFLREAAKKRTLEGWFEGREGFSSSSDAKAKEGGMNPALLKRVGVIGAGVMGSGIAQWLAACGCDVVLRDVEASAVARGMAVIRGLFDEAVKRGKLEAGAANAALQRIATTTSWEGFATCDLVVEAIVEDAAAKRALFTELAEVVGPDVLLASNTSALPIGEIAGHVPNPARAIGIHFFNPVSRMPLVELVLGEATSAETAGRALALVKTLGKSPVICRSSPGFLVTRVLFFYLNEAVRWWERGWATVTIDAALAEFGWPMGPLRLIDEVGVDVTDFIFGELAHYFPGRFERSTACAAMLAAGLRGRKNGASRGFYRYEGGVEIVNDRETRSLAGANAGENAVSSQECEPAEVVKHLMRVMVEEAERCVAEGVVKSPDVDFALLSGAGFPAFRGGLLHWARNHPAAVAPA